jgi:TRAP transporter TAXI family solute receptor
LVAPAAVGAERPPIVIATHEPGSSFHQIGSSLAELLNRDGVAAAVRPFANFSEYLPLIDRGEVEFGLVTGIEVGALYRATDARRLANVRAAVRLWKVRYAYLARSVLGIDNYAGLRGRRVGFDVATSATMSAVNAALMATVGLGRRDFRAEPIDSFAAGVQRLIAGELDAVPIAIGVPLGRQARAGIAGGVNYISLFGPNATTEFLGRRVPGLYLVDVQPDERIPELAEPVLAVAFDVFLVTSARTPDRAVAALLQAKLDANDEPEARHPVLRTFEATAGVRVKMEHEFSAPTNPVPYHPAAIRFFKERSMWNEDNEQAEQRAAGGG